jgi:aldose 1-epimerase
MVNSMDEAVSPSGAQWTISYGDQEAVLVEVGGGLRAWRVAGTDLVDGYAADELCPASAGQVLAPWPNRIRDGQYQFGGESHQLALSEPDRHNALHGLVNWLPWRLVDSSGPALTCECRLPAQTGYPWSLSLRTTWSLSEAGLRAEHWATNLAGSPAPFGFSIHPYLHLPGVSVSEVALRVPAQTRLLTDPRLLPIGAAKVDGTEFDFTSPRRIGEMVLDTAFGSVVPDPEGGSAVTLTSPDGSGLRIWADDSFHWWQVFTGDTLEGARNRRSVAVEPMTCPPDAFRSGRDLVTLEPAETWHATWTLSRL